MVRPLDIEIIAPQHGAFFPEREMCQQFIESCALLDCGVDLITPIFKVPGGVIALAEAQVYARDQNFYYAMQPDEPLQKASRFINDKRFLPHRGEEE